MAPVINKDFNKILYLPVEIVERELDAKLLLASEAVRRGYSVVIGNYWKVLDIAKDWGGGVFLYKDMIDQRVETFWKPLSQRDVELCVLDEEGLIFPSVDYYIRTRIGGGLSLPYLERIFTWGDRQRERIEKLDGYRKNALVTTGNPRIDLLRHPYLKIYEEDGVSRLGNKSGFVLINTNFGPGNYSPYFNMSYYEHMKSLGRIVTDDEVEYYKERVSYYAELFVQYKEMVARLAEEIFPATIVIRPHPVENHEAWREYFRDHKNVSVVYRGGVLEWIAASSCVIHTGCTTGLEAFVMGRPVLRYNPALRSDMESHLPNSLGEGFVDPASLISRVESILARQDEWVADSAQFSHLKSWVSNVCGDFSHMKIMDEIDSFDIKNSSVSLRQSAAVVVRNFLVDVKRYIYNYIGDNSHSDIVSKVQFLRRIAEANQRYSGLPLSRIQNRWKKICGIKFSSEDGGEKLVRIGPDVYMISANFSGVTGVGTP